MYLKSVCITAKVKRLVPSSVRGVEECTLTRYKVKIIVYKLVQTLLYELIL